MTYRPLWMLAGVLLALAAVATATTTADPALHVKQRFRHLTIEDGLSQSSIHCLLQDRRGFVWMGTQDGLNRYDGNVFEVWKTDADDSFSLTDSYITAIAEADDGTMWVGSEASGFGRFERTTWKFDTICQGPPRQAGETRNNYEVLALKLGPHGGVWVGTVSHGLLRYDPLTRELRSWYVGDGLPANEVTSLLFDDHDRLCIGTSAGLARLDPTNDELAILGPTAADPIGSQRLHIHALHRARDGNLWLGTDAGLARFDGERDGWKHVLGDQVGNHELLVGGAVRVIAEDVVGNLWLGNIGVTRFDPATGSGLYVHPDLHDPESLQTGNIQALVVDEAGVVWVGHDLGVSMLDTRAKKFHHYHHEVGEPNSLSNNTVWSIIEDRAGTVWVATDDGLCRFDLADDRVEVWRGDPKRLDRPTSSDNTMLFEDSRGYVWVGWSLGALDRYDPQEGEFRRFEADTSGQKGAPSLRSYDAAEAADGTIWFATRDGVQSYDPVTETFGTEHRQLGSVYDVGGLAVKTVEIANDGTLWFGTWGGGLVRIEPDRSRRTVFRHDATNQHSLTSDTIIALMIDRQGRVWAGTSAGLNRLDPRTGVWTRFTEKNGLPNNTIYALSEDGEGRIWASSNFGLSRLDPETFALEHFQARDGCQSNEFNMGAAHFGRSGHMYFGGINGFNVFNPTEIRANPYLPPVYVTEFRINNERVDPAAPNRGRQLLSLPIDQTDHIALDYKDHVLSFAFTSLHYAAPEKIRYRYMLDGFDSDWIEAGGRNHATYTNLPAGDYVFRVRATNSDGVWNDAGATLAVSVSPPFWKTNWFLVLAILVGLSALNAVVRYRTRLMKVRTRDLEHRVTRRTADLTRANHFLQQEITERRRVEEALRVAKTEAEEGTRAKSEFLANMSHEIRTPMNGVLGMTSVILSGDITPEQREHLEVVYGSARNLLSIINDILDFSKIEAGKLELERTDFEVRTLVEEVGEMLGPRAHDKGLAFHLRINHDVPTRLGGDPVRVRQILVNLINNAIKFTDEGKVVVHVDTVQDTGGLGLEFAVEDTGVGIPDDRKDCLFESFSQADTSTTRKYGGTGLGLAICKQLVDLMDGTIDVETSLGAGTTFRVRLVFTAPGEMTPAPELLAGKVLLVMSDGDQRRATVEALRYLGLESVAPDDGEDPAQQALLALAGTADWQAVIVGPWNGESTAQQVPRKVQAALGAAAPPCLTTVRLGDVIDAAEIRRQGYASWIAQPLRTHKLRQALESAETTVDVLPSAAVETAVEPPPAAADLVNEIDQLPLLLAEDNPINQKVASILLRKMGYKVEVVDNGAEAVAALTRRRYRLVFMDVQMPVMDGYEAVRRIRQGDGGVLEPGLPIVALTAHAMKGDRQRCLDAGMDDYLAKPLDQAALMAVLAKYLGAPATGQEILS